MKKLVDSAFYFIVGHGRGWVFSSVDLLEKFSRSQTDNLLSELVKKGKIKRVARGIYIYPKYSKLLDKGLSADIELVAQAYARKFNWSIEVTGESALNILGLFTQVTGIYKYLSNGENRTYKLYDGRVLEFKKSALKNIGFKYKESSLFVQALKALGKDKINDNVVLHLKETFDDKVCLKIIKDTKSVTSWIYEAIKEICKR